MTEQQRIGKLGEELASKYLSSKGYQIIEHNWRHGKAEIDIICKNESALIFVEVKARSGLDFGAPELAVNKKKEELLFAAANRYMEAVNYEWEVRFDVVTVLLLDHHPPEIRHFKDVFH